MKKTLGLIYTTFPKPSEEFLRREALELIKSQEVELVFFSILGGGKFFEGYRVERLGILGVLWAVVLGIGELFCGRNVWVRLWPERWAGWSNWGENALGLAAGLVWKRKLARCDALHAQWGTAPAMAAWVACRQGEGPTFTMALNAYDLFEEGGDGWLGAKTKACSGIISSNACAAAEVARRFPNSRKTLIRRILRFGEAPAPKSKNDGIIRLLSAGRLVEKKGLPELLDIALALKKAGVDYVLEIVGEGPLRGKLQDQIKRNDLTVRLLGWLDPKALKERMRAADLFLFTGKRARSGDSDGLPNVIAEAFEVGTVVVAHEVGDVASAVVEGATGRLMATLEPAAWVVAIKETLADRKSYDAMAQSARAWVVEAFDPEKNIRKFLDFTLGKDL